MRSFRVTVVGTGYVGLVSGTCLAEVGHRVTCLDQDAGKIDQLLKGRIPIHEPLLAELVAKNLGQRLTFTTDHAEAIRSAEVVMVAVGTPSAEDGSADLSAVWQVADQIAEHANGPIVVAIKSTVPVGTGDKLQERFSVLLRERLSDQAPALHVVSNPEFLREGRAVLDFLKGDRVVIGGNDPGAVQTVVDLYAPLKIPIVTCDRRSSEMIKYASNAFLATKISFINSVARLCDRLGADVTKVAEGMGYDHRIMPEHLRAGLGYGGSCFPKDVAALLHMAQEAGVAMRQLEATVEVNALQVDWVVEKLERLLGSVEGKALCLWGIAFKPDTDDVREAPFFRLAERLLAKGAILRAYDPVASPASLPERVTLFRDPYESAADADAVVLITEWAQLAKLDWGRVRSLMAGTAVVDGRNFFDPAEPISRGFRYEDLGRYSSVGPLLECERRVDDSQRKIC